MSLDHPLAVARQAASEAGEILMRYLREGVEMRNKTASGGVAHDLVSDADLESERRIGELLGNAFPDHELLGEETLAGAPDAEHLWIIDPLDGTTNYAHGLPHFAVSIAYYHRGEPQLGVIYNPAREDWFVALRGSGATHNGRSVQVTPATKLDEVLVGCGFYYDRGAMMRATLASIEELFTHQIHGIRRFGTAALDLCQVGCGHFGGYFEYLLSPWDFAAGRLFVEEAGGRVTTATGEPLPMQKTSLLASNGHLHEPIQSIVAKHYGQGF
ncbi:inositol monophosphatase family protein [Candidatus Laterigemmans baculatus]|uniref:inositol monophosphatase family protein n=1 Tax=Candidatus Laterigemmans baculatus TaxID=2770505 RepID=UPI0013DCB95E|nr:inositol monophosphatase family protein [Candidatus Laterigemmans baculatus]